MVSRGGDAEMKVVVARSKLNDRTIRAFDFMDGAVNAGRSDMEKHQTLMITVSLREAGTISV
jgi:hypothetical protein